MKLLLCTFFMVSLAHAQLTTRSHDELPPLMELGGGVVSFSMPDYPGAANDQWYTIPYAIGLIRHDIIRVDEDGGARGRFMNAPNYELSMSASITFSSDNEDNPVREGMPSLDGVGEIGPSVIFRLKKISKESPYKIGLAVPLRYAFSTDWKKFTDRGLVFNPFLYLIHKNVFSEKNHLIVGLDVRFATERYMDYYYQVDSQYATATRPAYDAQGGYLQSALYMAFGHTIKKKHTFYIAYQYASLHSSRNEDSTLLAKRDNQSMAIGYTWWFWESGVRGIR